MGESNAMYLGNGQTKTFISGIRPVTFRYTQAYSDGAKPIQYGLVAEEVAEVFPELAVRGADGQVETVHYEILNVLLLNELQKQQAHLREAVRGAAETVPAHRSTRAAARLAARNCGQSEDASRRRERCCLA